VEDLVERLRKRAEIRRQIPNRKSVLLGETDRISDLLEEAAGEIERLRYMLELRSGGCTWVG
jgi:hypothetical protein